MKYSIEIGKIIEGALKHDQTKVFNYTKQLVSKLEKDGDSRSAIKFKRLFFEGVSFCENAKLGGFLMTKIMLAKQKKGLKNPKLTVEKMSKMLGGQAGRVMAERFLRMNPLSIKNIVRDCSNVRLPKMDAEMQRSCVFSYGEYDSDLRLAKKKFRRCIQKRNWWWMKGMGTARKW